MHPGLQQFKWQISAAEGYLMLEMPQDAWEELQNVGNALDEVPEIILLRLHILNKLQRWEEASALGRAAIERHPRQGDLYLLTAYAQRRFEDVAHAKPILLAGEAVLEKEAAFHYNLACYECQLGNDSTAKARLERAFALDKNYKLTALEDEDLSALRPWISSHP